MGHASEGRDLGDKGKTIISHPSGVAVFDCPLTFMALDSTGPILHAISDMEHDLFSERKKGERMLAQAQ